MSYSAEIPLVTQIELIFMALTNHLFDLSLEVNTSVAHGIAHNLILDTNSMNMAVQNQRLRRLIHSMMYHNAIPLKTKKATHRLDLPVFQFYWMNTSDIIKRYLSFNACHLKGGRMCD